MADVVEDVKNLQIDDKQQSEEKKVIGNKGVKHRIKYEEYQKLFESYNAQIMATVNASTGKHLENLQQNVQTKIEKIEKKVEFLTGQIGAMGKIIDKLAKAFEEANEKGKVEKIPEPVLEKIAVEGEIVDEEQPTEKPGTSHGQQHEFKGPKLVAGGIKKKWYKRGGFNNFYGGDCRSDHFYGHKFGRGGRGGRGGKFRGGRGGKFYGSYHHH